MLLVVSFGKTTEDEGEHAWCPGEKPSYSHTAVSVSEVCLSSLRSDRKASLGGSLNYSLFLYLCLALS